MASCEKLKHLNSPEFVAGKPPESQNEVLQGFVQPHIESFNYVLEEGLKNAVQVASVGHDATNETLLSLPVSTAQHENACGVNDAFVTSTAICLGGSADSNSHCSLSVTDAPDIIGTMLEEKDTLLGGVEVALKDDNGDDIEFEDELMEDETTKVNDDHAAIPSLCSQPFTDQVDHAILDQDQTSNEADVNVNRDKSARKRSKLACEECGRFYATKYAVRNHLKTVHGKEFSGFYHKGTSRCIHPGCDELFYHRQKMINHLRDVHGVNCVQEDLVFNSWDEFLLWKEKEEDANFVHFSKNSTHTNAKNYMLANFTCQREGKVGYKYTGSQQKRFKDLVIGEKICPARISARLSKPSGKVTVQYCKSHNHKMSFQDFLYRRMPDRLRLEIRQMLAAGKSSEEVYKELRSLDELRENRGETFAPSKRHFVSLVNIKTIAKRMHIKEQASKCNPLNPEPYAIQMQKLRDESYNPVLLYKDAGCNVEVGPGEIDTINGSHTLLLIALQTKEQKEMFVRHCSRIVFIDITEPVITPPHYIVTVKVLDEHNRGYPVAYLITNSRDETALFYYFHELKARAGDSCVVRAVMTENVCNEYYVFRRVFGEDVKHLLCKWNLHRAWCQKIHEECIGEETLQQELYFIFVSMLEERDLGKFESVANEFVSNYQTRCPNFIAFFVSNYLSQSEMWATCCRNIPDADCDEILYADRLFERVKRQLKSNNAKLRILDDVLDLVLRFEHEDYFNRGLNMILNPPQNAQEELISEHDHGMKIDTSEVTGTENCWVVGTVHASDVEQSKRHSVSWKADICEKDFCRERCLKLACFGLCDHLYECTCQQTTITPCRHIHKVHSMRIGMCHTNDEVKATSGDEDVKTDLDSIPKTSNDEEKLNLVQQPKPTNTEHVLSKKEKLERIKNSLASIYDFLGSDNILKYSLDFIDAGLKRVIDECEVINSIGTKAETKVKKRKPTSDFQLYARICNKRKRLACSSPVLVNIEPNNSLITCTDRSNENMLSSEKPITTTTCPASDVEFPSLLDTTNRSSQIVFKNSHFSFNMIQLKALDVNVTEAEKETLANVLPGYHLGCVTDEVFDSYLSVLSEKTNSLHVSLKQMNSMKWNEPHKVSFWRSLDLKQRQRIFVPWRYTQDGDEIFQLFVVCLSDRTICYYNPLQHRADTPQNIQTAHSTLIGLMAIELATFNQGVHARTLVLKNGVQEDDAKNSRVRCLWYAHQIAHDFPTLDCSSDMSVFRNNILSDVSGQCLDRLLVNSLTCAVCKDQPRYTETITCQRCDQTYHSKCLPNLSLRETPFVCPVY